MVYPVEVVFAPKKSIIVIEVGSTYTVRPTNKPTPEKILSDVEKGKLDEGVSIDFSYMYGTVHVLNVSKLWNEKYHLAMNTLPYRA